MSRVKHSEKLVLELQEALTNCRGVLMGIRHEVRWSTQQAQGIDWAIKQSDKVLDRVSDKKAKEQP